MDIVYPETNRIICSNHFQGKEFANDEINLENIQGSDSYARYKRVEELLDRYQVLNPRKVADILRDQRALGDSDAGMGNQLAVNQLIAHHSIVFKPDSLQVWVSTAPWQLGKYVTYDLRKVFKTGAGYPLPGSEITAESLTIAPDTFLNSTAYSNYNSYRLMTSQLREFKDNGESLPGEFVKEYTGTNPSLYLTYVNLGDYYREVKEDEQAVKYYTLALEKKLPGLDERKKLEELIDKLKN